MTLFDDLNKELGMTIAEVKKCPRCDSVSFTIDKSSLFPKAECNHCHLRIEVSSRNNIVLSNLHKAKDLLEGFIKGTK